MLNEAYKTPMTIFKTTDLSFNKDYGTLYHFDFSDMLQINTESKKKRVIRRTAHDEPPAKKVKASDEVLPGQNEHENQNRNEKRK